MLRGRATIAALLLLLLIAGCEVGTGESRRVSIRHLTSLHRGYPLLLTENISIEGVVISSDRHGEFHNRIVLQDATGGISICISHKELHTLHAIGDSLRVECRGLVLGAYGRAVRLGAESAEGSDYQVEPLELPQWMAHHTPLGIADKLTPAPTLIADLSAEKIATLCLFEGVRFVEAGEKWVPEGESITRHIVDTQAPSDTLAVRISKGVIFGSERIPAGECGVVGVMDYFNDGYQLVLLSEEAVLPKSEN